MIELGGVTLRKIVDVSMFFNEVELLEIRLSALNNKVDKFIVIESSQTFSGAKKIDLSELSILKNSTVAS